MGKVVSIHSTAVAAADSGETAVSPVFFTSRQLVRWSQAGKDFDDGFFVRQFGDRPFMVKSVMLVRATCVSPGLCFREIHHPVCNVRRADVIDHPQVVELDSLRSPFDGYPLRISGKYLSKV